MAWLKFIMKIKDRKKRLEEQFQQHINDLNKLVEGYNPNNFDELTMISNSIAAISEYVLHQQKFRTTPLFKYFSSVYKYDICLVLAKNQVICNETHKILPNDSQISFTRNNIVKFLRGEKVHMNEIPSVKKLDILNNFIDEKSNYGQIFCIGHNFIRTPFFIEPKKSDDSGGSIMYSLYKSDGSVVKLSAVESIVFNVFNEYASICNRGVIRWKKSMISFIDKETSTLSPMLKEQIGDNILKQVPNWVEWGLK